MSGSAFRFSSLFYDSCIYHFVLVVLINGDFWILTTDNMSHTVIFLKDIFHFSLHHSLIKFRNSLSFLLHQNHLHSYKNFYELARQFKNVTILTLWSFLKYGGEIIYLLKFSFFSTNICIFIDLLILLLNMFINTFLLMSPSVNCFFISFWG